MRAAAIFLLLIFTAFSSGAQEGKKITIMHTNDLHSRLIGYAPELAYTPFTLNDDKTIGGFARIAAIIKSEKSKSEGISLVLDAGDFLMGTLFQGLEPSTGFQLRLMKTMGYDVTCIGNHEFDFGPGYLARIISTSAKSGPIPDVLLSNAVFSDKDNADDALASLFDAGIIKRRTIIEKNGIKFGFFSLMGVVADENASFAPPVTFASQVQAAKKMVSELQAEGCNLVICLSHSGVTEGKSGTWEGEDVELARKVKGIDIIISGHTHTKLDNPVLVNGVPIVQAGEYGQYVGKLSLTYINGHIRVDDYSLIPVDDRIKGDSEINSMIEDQKNAITGEILKPIGMDYESAIAESDFLLECNEMGDIEGSNLGPLVADAIYSYINNHVKKGTDVSFVAVGVIRDKIVPGMQTAPDIFRIMSMGNGGDNVPGYPLSRVYVTGHELKNILEVLLLSGKSTPANYCYFSGIMVDYDPDRGLLKKIRKITIIRKDGTQAPVDFSKKDKSLYSLSASNYIVENVGIIRKMSKGLINIVLKDSSGNPIIDKKSSVLDMDESKEGLQEGKEWLAVAEFLSAMKDQNGNGVPDIDHKYKSAVKSFTVVKSK